MYAYQMLISINLNFLNFVRSTHKHVGNKLFDPHRDSGVNNPFWTTPHLITWQQLHFTLESASFLISISARSFAWSNLSIM